MKPDEIQSIHKTLGDELKSSGYDLVDLVSIPQTSNRTVVIKSLQEALDRFEDENDDGSISYIFQVRPKKEAPKAERPSEALELDQIYQKDGQLNTSFLLENAAILLAARDYTLAKNIYRTVFLSGECTSEALLGTGMCLLGEGKVKDAEEYFEESVAYRPSAEAYSQLVSILISTGRDQYAVELIERAVCLSEIQDELKFELLKTAGNCSSRIGEMSEAKRFYNQALLVEPKASEIHSNLGSILLQEGKLEEAKQSFRNALTVSSRNPKAYAGLGCCYLAESKKREAMRAFLTALKVEINDPASIFYLIKCAYDLKEYQQAEKIVGDYVKIAPFNANLLYSLAGLHYHCGHLQQSLQAIKKVLRIQPDHEGARELLGILESKTLSGRTDGETREL